MKLHFLGANRQVTGSRYCLETNSSRVMIDCGMFQERQFQSRNWRTSVIPPESINALLLTHAHIDHCGLIPRLVRDGYRSPIYTTAATADLLDIMLRDAAHIQAEDLAYKIKRHRKEGRTKTRPLEALFDESDVDRTMSLVQPVKYHESLQITEDLSVKFWEAGHILGSAMLDVHAGRTDQKRRIIFSGDIGQWNKPLIHDPTIFDSADYLVMESTYGDRDHTDGGDILDQLQSIVNTTIQDGGNVVIPTFAVERAQELMYYFSQLVHHDRIPDVPIYLDSPMAVDVTKVFQQHRDRFDADAWKEMMRGMHPLDFPGLVLSRSTAESKAINEERRPCIIMSTSGMCTAGRIKHHLRLNLPRRESTIVFVGYQAHGTLGRQILEGNKEVRIHGKMQKVRAKVAQIFGFSGHADRGGLLRWLEPINPAPRRLFLTHGDEEAANAIATTIRQEKHWRVLIPDYESSVDLE